MKLFNSVIEFTVNLKSSEISMHEQEDLFLELNLKKRGEPRGSLVLLNTVQGTNPLAHA